ncbi:MAG TPA: hypothetical protein VHR86_00905, partial [Armatimonadota bacterium]|nr:hypothetical protein [Armatimonadota bacterium]
LCTIDWTGWKLVSGKFDAALQPQWGGKETPGGFSYPLSFSELTLDTGTAASAPSGAFYLDDFRVQSLFAGSDIMMADLTTAWSSNAGVGNDPGVKLRIHNFDERDRHINITCIVQDLWGTVIPQGKITPMVAHAGTITQMPIAMTLPHRGYYTATFTLTAADTPGWRIQRSCSLASLPPAPNTIDAASPFGVNGHTSGEHMNEYGVGFSRTDWFWGFAQPRADTWDFTAYDRMLDNIHAHHLEIFPVITYNPGWLKPKAGFGTDHAAYLTYVRRTVERYKGRVRYWDLWNEPDLTWHGSPQEFGDVMYEAYKIIKEVDPQATVVYPSISGANLDGFLTESLTSLHGHFPFDVLGIHPYTRPLSPDEGNLQQVLLRAKQWMAAHGDSKPIWISECGWPTATDNSSVTEMQQAAYLTRLFTIALSAGVQKTVWYQPFSGTNPDDPESEFGFLRHDYSPKPASCALAQLTHRLRGAKYLRELHLGTYTRCYLFQTSTQTVAILYATKRPFQLNLQLPKGLVLEAMDGAPLPARTPINIGAEPVYFVIQNKQEQSLEQALLQHRMTNAVPADIELSLQAQRVVVDIKNALIHPLTATVTVQGPTGWTFRDGAQRTVTLSPEGETTLTFPVSYPQNAIQSTIHLLFSALGRKTDLAFPVRIIPIPRVPSA